MKLIKSPMKFYNGRYGIDWSFKDVAFPVIATVKYNGEFLMKDEDQIFTRQRKPFANPIVSGIFLNRLKNGHQGEIVIPGWTFHEIAGWCNKKNVTDEDIKTLPEVMLFDWIKHPFGSTNYYGRIRDCEMYVETQKQSQVQVVEYTFCDTGDDVLRYYEDKVTRDGAEGLVLRDQRGEYKHGRSTLKEGLAFKMIILERKQGRICGFTKSDVTPGRVAAVIVDTPEFGKITLGTGFDYTTAKDMFNRPHDYIGSLCNYEYRPHGMKDMPKQPVYGGLVLV